MIDLFKADIYSLGITFYFAVTKEKYRKINTKRFELKEVYEKLHETDLPI